MPLSTLQARISQIDAVNEYFRRVDAGEFAAELFTPDFEFYFPKYGLGHGAAEFSALAEGLMTTKLKRASHHLGEFLYIDQDDKLAVEGTTEGMGVDGVEWHGGRTPGGRFCSVFAFNAKGLIERMYIYMDPDYTGRDTEGFIWPRRSSQQW
jgi:hypothetical protein